METAGQDRTEDKNTARPQEESYKRGDKPEGRLSGTGKPPVAEREPKQGPASKNR